MPSQKDEESNKLISNETQSTNKTDFTILVEETSSKSKEYLKNILPDSLASASHPIACFFTFFFKLLALLSFLFLKLFDVHSILIFIIVTLNSAFDFWTVKNITGRLLVGLRWWSKFLEDGSEIWRFESQVKQDQQSENQVDAKFFWTSQLGFAIIWVLISFYYLIGIHLFWGGLAGICLALCGVNLFAFYKCRGDHQKKLNNIQNDMQNYIKQQGLKAVGGAFLNKFLS